MTRDVEALVPSALFLVRRAPPKKQKGRFGNRPFLVPSLVASLRERGKSRGEQ